MRDVAVGSEGYALVICEKPDAARRVSDALSDGSAKSIAVGGATAFKFSRNGQSYIVCSAQGHLYEISDPCDERTVYPVFDIEWYPSSVTSGVGEGGARRLGAIRTLAPRASRFINACDFDGEGETIGFNLLRYACGRKEEAALRARFSTLTERDLVAAFDEAAPQSNQGMARAGRTRHYLDFVWGVNFSRFLSLTSRTMMKYRTLSIGRVQGPTLAFLVDRESEIRKFVPIPFWKVVAKFAKGDSVFQAEPVREKITTRQEADSLRSQSLAEGARVARARSYVSSVGAPPPFDLGELQKEAYRIFGYPPNKTVRLAEALYLKALISYPRTGSQTLPPSIGYREILNRLRQMKQFTSLSDEVLGGELAPVQGRKMDQAHPAIYPTGETPARPLRSEEASLYDLVARRFLAAFGQAAVMEHTKVEIMAGEVEYTAEGSRILRLGWMKPYGRYSAHRDVELPSLSAGDKLKVVEVVASERFEQRPPRYSQSTLLERMEREKIGTKATRSDIIATLVNRKYVEGEGMMVTDLGFAVAEVMDAFAPPIMTTGFTRRIEEGLEEVERGAAGEKEILRKAIREIAIQLSNLETAEAEVGRLLGGARFDAPTSLEYLGPCPVCKGGSLKIVRSKKTKKRFVGCTNYGTGCRASAPLPQRGVVKATGVACRYCSWPEVRVTGRRPWRFCVNPNCPSRAGR